MATIVGGHFQFVKTYNGRQAMNEGGKVRKKIEVHEDLRITPEDHRMIADAGTKAAVWQCQQVSTPTQYVEAGAALVDIKGQTKLLTAKRLTLTRPLDETKARIMEMFAAPIHKLKRAEEEIKNALLRFKVEEDRMREESERVARDDFEKEQAKVERSVERKAHNLENKGDFAAAAEARSNKPIMVQSQPAEVRPAVVAGIHRTETWRHRIIDPSLLPRDCLVPNDKMLAAFAKSTKGRLAIPGVEFYPEQSISAQARGARGTRGTNRLEVLTDMEKHTW